MQLTKLTIQNITEGPSSHIVTIPSSGIEFISRNHLVTLNEPLEIKISHNGCVDGIEQSICFTSGNTNKFYSLFFLVTCKEFYDALHKALRSCKVIPMYKPPTVQEVFAAQYTNAYEQLSNPN